MEFVHKFNISEGATPCTAQNRNASPDILHQLGGVRYLLPQCPKNEFNVLTIWIIEAIKAERYLLDNCCCRLLVRNVTQANRPFANRFTDNTVIPFTSLMITTEEFLVDKQIHLETCRIQ